jgi:hypothetical protein
MPSDVPSNAVAGFDEKLAGRRAECDGGGPLMGTHYAARLEFTGTLTGDYVDHGDPPWRWYLMVDLTEKPAGYPGNTVWCEVNSIFCIDEDET